MAEFYIGFEDGASRFAMGGMCGLEEVWPG